METRTEGLAFFDTNVLVAASLAEHVHHKASSARLATFQNGGGACSAHSLAESYTALTRLSGYRLAPPDAFTIIRYASKTYTLVTLTAIETTRAIEDVAMRGLVGPLIYDALLLACARKVDARAIYTHNVKHFRQIAPDLEDRIRIP